MPADASKLRAALGSWATQVVAVAGPETARIAQRDARVPIGESRELVGSIRARHDVRVSGTERTVTVIAPVIQAATTDKGARAHRIVPRRAGGVLVFHWPKAGGVVFLRHVNHPGNPPRPWWEAVLRDAWRTALRTAARRTSL
jgi:hypothetical protein